MYTAKPPYSLFVHLHAAYLSVCLVTGGSFHSIAFSSHVFIVTFTFPIHLHLSVVSSYFHPVFVLYRRHTCLLLSLSCYSTIHT